MMIDYMTLAVAKKMAGGGGGTGCEDKPAVIAPIEITENGTYTPPSYVDGYAPVTVNVQGEEITTQEKTVTPTTSAQTVKPDSGYDALSQVTVNAMPTAAQGTPSISVSNNGLITASVQQTAGYVTAGTKSATQQLPTQGAQTITPGKNAQTIASGKYLTGAQTIAGDDNLLAENIKSGVSVFGVEGTFEGEGGSSGGGDEQFVALIEGWPTVEIRNANVKKIDLYGFYGKSNLLTADFPACRSIMQSAFYSCSYLESINFPACEYIGPGAFANCVSITDVDFPVCTEIKDKAFLSCLSLINISSPLCTTVGNSAFAGCLALSTPYFPECSFIGGSAFLKCRSISAANFQKCLKVNEQAFYNCTGLKTVNLPECSYIGNSVFFNCTSLNSVNMPKASYIGNYAFSECHALVSITLPLCSEIGKGVFINCSLLTTAILPACTGISTGAFQSCSNLSALVLGGSTLCTLRYSNVFEGCDKIADGTGFIFVPASLVDAYRSATNWAYVSAQISAIEDSEFA